MPNDWAVKVSNAINNLKLKTDRVVEPDQSLALIDDVVAGKFAAAELAVIHGLPQEGVRTTLGRVTRAVARVASGHSRPVAGMPSRDMNTLTRWLPVSPPPGSRCVAYRDEAKEFPICV
jgi:hypothetical protein